MGKDAIAAISLLTPVIHQQLNQAVLLKGINNTLTVLSNLSELLFANNILPYYLHQMDPVASAGQFICGDTEAQELMAELRISLPGYLVPKLVRELAGEFSKTPI
jgi:L-lysine 2,3-aminomutase